MWHVTCFDYVFFVWCVMCFHCVCFDWCVTQGSQLKAVLKLSDQVFLTVGGKPCVDIAVGDSHIDCTVPQQSSGKAEVLVGISEETRNRAIVFNRLLFFYTKFPIKLTTLCRCLVYSL